LQILFIYLASIGQGLGVVSFLAAGFLAAGFLAAKLST
jgi:hypothetical protein